MTDNCIDDFILGQANIEEGPAGAETYQITATKTLRELPFELLGHEFRPLLELPLCLEFVDQNANDDFFVSNFAFQLRWVDFPWNHRLNTSFGAGRPGMRAVEITTSACATRLATSTFWRSSQLGGIGRA